MRREESFGGGGGERRDAPTQPCTPILVGNLAPQCTSKWAQGSVWEAPGGPKFHIRRAPATGSDADCFPTVVREIITETVGADKKCWTVTMRPPFTFPLATGFLLKNACAYTTSVTLKPMMEALF